MKKLRQSGAKRFIFSLFLASALSGCAVYQPGYNAAYIPNDAYQYTPAPPVYSVAPVYVEPLYIAPPVFFNFGHGFGGGYHHRGFHRGHHWRSR